MGRAGRPSGFNKASMEKMEVLRAMIRKNPDWSIEDIGEKLGWHKKTTVSIFQKIRHEYKKVWVNRADYPQFWRDHKSGKS